MWKPIHLKIPNLWLAISWWIPVTETLEMIPMKWKNEHFTAQREWKSKAIIQEFRIYFTHIRTQGIFEITTTSRKDTFKYLNIRKYYFSWILYEVIEHFTSKYWSKNCIFLLWKTILLMNIWNKNTFSSISFRELSYFSKKIALIKKNTYLSLFFFESQSMLRVWAIYGTYITLKNDHPWFL